MAIRDFKCSTKRGRRICSKRPKYARKPPAQKRKRMWWNIWQTLTPRQRTAAIMATIMLFALQCAVIWGVCSALKALIIP